MKKNIIVAIAVICSMIVLCAAFDVNVRAASAQSTGIANPWVETDADGLMQTLGLQFDVPEGAEGVTYRMNESEKLAEMRFTLYDMPFTARIKPAGLELEDISGMFYDWDYVESVKGEFARRWHQEKLMAVRDGEDMVEVYLWFDIVPGLTYSLSTKAHDLNGFDIIAVAEMVYHQVQGNS